MFSLPLASRKHLSKDNKIELIHCNQSQRRCNNLLKDLGACELEEFLEPIDFIAALHFGISELRESFKQRLGELCWLVGAHLLNI